MIQTEQETIAVPGEMMINGKETAPQNQTAFSSMIPFDKVKQHLSDKPLRRPNRTRPIEQPKKE